jgi:hypothetical protein
MNPSSERIRLDSNCPVFQQQLFALPKQEQLAVLSTLRKLSSLTWPQLYRDSGLHWELIHSKFGPNGNRLYSLRIGKGFRAVACRQAEWLRILFLHPDHDSAYQ